MLPSVKIQNLGPRALNIPFTFGQVFAPGHFQPTDGLRDLQVDVKATHADGSVRHAIISGVLGGLDAGETYHWPLKIRPEPYELAGMPAAPSVAVHILLDGVMYSAESHAGKFIQEWLSGSIVSELQTMMPLTTVDGRAHPHLTARFAIRVYAQGPDRVDVTIENNWAYEPDPQNFTYDVEIESNGHTLYKQSGLTHFHHSRWRHVAWNGEAPQINVQLDIPYLIVSKAVPNYDQSAPPSPALLQSIANRIADPKLSEPMAIGLAVAYMPTTGGRDDIGLLPMWATAYLLSMDVRARDATLITADGAGSWPTHYRDQKTDHPISLLDYRAMTLGRASDSYNDESKKFDAFPTCVAPADTPYTVDTSHQANFVYLPYLVTGDYFYLEELQFWAMWNAFGDTPAYRQWEKGLMSPGQVRAQAWTMRTLAEAAYITPDNHPLKDDFNTILSNNFDWYIGTYIDNAATSNKLGVLTNGYALAYAKSTGVAPWQDDFFTSAIGHAADLGYAKAARLLTWKAQAPVLRMADPGTFWPDAALYSLIVKPTTAGTVYSTFSEAFRASHTPEFNALLDAGDTDGMLRSLGVKSGEMTGYATSVVGYPSNMQPALAYAVDYGIPGARPAWALFMARTVKPDYTNGSQFSIVPRTQGEIIMTRNVTVTLALAAQTLPYASEAAATFNRVQVRDADGVTVIATLDSAPYQFDAIPAGPKVLYAVGIDSNGKEMGKAYTELFSVPADDVEVPADPPIREVQLPSGATITFS